MPGISTGGKIGTTNGGGVNVPYTNDIVFGAGLILTNLGGGQVQVVSGSAAGDWSTLGNTGANLKLGTTDNETFYFIANNNTLGGFNPFAFFLRAETPTPFSDRSFQVVPIVSVGAGVQNYYDNSIFLAIGQPCVFYFKVSVQGMNAAQTVIANFIREFTVTYDGTNLSVSPVQSSYTYKFNYVGDLNIDTATLGHIILGVDGVAGETITWTSFIENQGIGSI